jgi:hypothetical protein
MEYAAAVEVLRISVNAGNSLGSAGLETNLAPAMTIGTGYFGRSSVGENLQPSHLVQWTRLAYNRDPAERFGNFTGLVPWEAPAGPVPPYPVASNQRDSHQPALAPAREPVMPARSADHDSAPDSTALREEIRRLILEELSQLARG